MSKKILIAAIVLLPLLGMAQTDIDAIMMEKKALCVGPMYSYSSWKNYWEGTLKRDNENLGTVSTQMIGVMGTYGVSKKLNVLFGAPYVITKASAGTLHGQKGIQDLSLFVKWRPFQKKIGDVVQVHQAIQRGSADLMEATKFIAKQPGGLGEVVNQLRILGLQIGGMMIDDDPVRFIETRFKAQVADPGRFFVQAPLPPTVIMVCLEGDFTVE